MQSAVEQFFLDPKNYDDGSDAIEVIKTHAAIIFLGKQDVYKIKQPVTYSYMDFSTLEQRQAACERELELNRQFAPSIYIDLVQITENEDGLLQLNGDGRVIEYAVHMHRFPEECLLHRVAENRKLTNELASRLGVMIAAYQKGLTPDFSIDQISSVKHLAEQLNEVFNSSDCFHAPLRREFEQLSRRHLQNLSADLYERSRKGFVRRCHGDLHLKNIVVLDGEPTLFDALEFDENLATIDVLYDLSFLIMDMLHSEQPVAANITFNRYVSDAWDLIVDGGLRVLPLFLALRAGVRAMVSSQMAAQVSENVGSVEADANRYLSLANLVMRSRKAQLIAVGGFSGSGKSTLAKVLAPNIDPKPGAIILRSDVERKKMFNVPETQKLPTDAYDQATSERVYGVLLYKAKTVLAQGHSVIIDAVNASSKEREALEEVAISSNVSFQGFWLEAPETVLQSRVAKRKNDASDADANVISLQHQRHGFVTQKLSQSWMILDASQSSDNTLFSATKCLDRKVRNGS